MARSIHTTRASLARVRAQDVSRAEVRDQAVERARGELRRKRGMKIASRAGRRPHERGPTALETVAVAVFDCGAHVWFPADERDVRELLRRLPRGVTDGLRRVEMRLGRQTQDELAQRDAAGEEPDPFTGRWSYPRFPGAWSGRIVGRYRPHAAAVELYAYVIDPAHPLRAAWAPLLRLEALSILAHEVAHHHDHTERVARGRWRAGEREAVERYAERMQHQWTRSVVLPYLRERYADEVAAVESWVETYGGVALRFEELADDPRITGRGGWVHGERLLWPMSGALRELAEAVDRGERRWECRLCFARELYFQSRFDAALAAVRRVLRARPGEPRVLLLKAEVLLGMERHAEALEIGRALTRSAGATEHAWRVVADACAELGRWNEAEAALAQRLELAAAEGLPLHPILIDRAHLRILSGDLAGALRDLDAIDCGGRPHLQRRVARLRAEAAAGPGPALRADGELAADVRGMR